ncbi:MAG: DUF3536 domain-containing protein [Dehalococcoidia bacterium]
MDRFVCVHGHFYQPPRENPWLEAIEQQDSAYPYHDWNERITAQCYGPNAASRILDGEGRIVKISNNYSRMSYNVGPTLIKWMQDAAPEVYKAVLDADRLSAERFSGHGSAIAQCYNHMIMPLSNSRDKYTQVAWGIRDFEHRFGRRPEGMWLPETAVDLETLEFMAQLGIKFTILEPGQAKRVRPAIGRSRAWKDVSGGQIDPTRAYFARMSSGQRMSIFFYDGPISRAVAFEGILKSGEAFAERLLSGFSDERDWPQLTNIATDGESYGHHHEFGDMALAYALAHIEDSGVAKLTNYGEYLGRYPAQQEVEIWENTAWSCVHGVERWNSNCGCNTGGNPEWNQEWRHPLREALDWLRDTLASRYEETGRRFFRDPWEARNKYIDVILDRSDENIGAYLRRVCGRELGDGERIEALKLLELQRHAMLMFTSCGWFFDELSGIETTQVIQYAGRAVQLGQEVFGDGIEEHFLEMLAEAKSNIPEHGDGRVIYEKFVRTAMVDLPKVAAHYAVSSLFEDYADSTRIYCYEVQAEDRIQQSEGAAQMAVGRARVRSVITDASDVLSFGVLHFGDHNISAGVRPYDGDDAFGELNEAIRAFQRADLPEVLRILDKHFGDLTYSLRSLFRDEQRNVLQSILGATMAEMEASHRQIFDHHAPLMRFLTDVGYPMPAAFGATSQLVINSNLRDAVREERPGPERIAALLEDAATWKIEMDRAGIAYCAEQAAEAIARRFAETPDSRDLLTSLEAVSETIKRLPFSVDVSRVQNLYWKVLQQIYPAYRERANQGDTEAREWADRFRALGVSLSVRVE